jgi:hypothetical protein
VRDPKLIEGVFEGRAGVEEKLSAGEIEDEFEDDYEGGTDTGRDACATLLPAQCSPGFQPVLELALSGFARANQIRGLMYSGLDAWHFRELSRPLWSFP